MTRRGPDVLKIPEVAADLRVDRKTVYQLIRSGELRALKMGRALRVTRDALEQFKAVAVRSPPDRARPPGRRTEGVAGPSAAERQVTAASITDLSDWRCHRLLVPWPGWWGEHERRSWTWAERSA